MKYGVGSHNGKAPSRKTRQARRIFQIFRPWPSLRARVPLAARRGAVDRPSF